MQPEIVACCKCGADAEGFITLQFYPYAALMEYYGVDHPCVELVINSPCCARCLDLLPGLASLDPVIYNDICDKVQSVCEVKVDQKGTKLVLLPLSDPHVTRSRAEFAKLETPVMLPRAKPEQRTY